MCLIFYRNHDKHTTKINWSNLHNAYTSNPDGVGIAWVVQGKQWRVWRSVGIDWKPLRRRIQAIDNLTGISRLAVHFRFATHGGADLLNCHPFQVSGESYLFHNGCFSGVETGKDDESDTRQVADKMSAIVKSGGRLRSAWQLAKLLAGSNRLLLTLPNGKIAWAGNWEVEPDGCYSNANCFERKYAKTYSYSYSGKDIGFNKWDDKASNIASKYADYARKGYYSQGCSYDGYGRANRFDNAASNASLPDDETVVERETDIYSQNDEMFLTQFARKFHNQD